MSFPKPPFDPELAALMAANPGMNDPDLTPETLPFLRTFFENINPLETILAGKSITHEQHTVAVPGGEIILSVFKPVGAKEPTPGIYFIHGGGMAMGNRFAGLPQIDSWVEKFGATIIAVEYRLAPEHQYPIPLDDSYAGLKWVGEHLTELGIDGSRLMTAGHSAGGNLALAVALRARDENGPKICGQLLLCPMLDHRNESISVKQFFTEGSWTGKINEVAWNMYLGDHGKGEGAKVDILASPGLAEVADLVGLPATFIDVGSAEPFRDEDIALAGKLSQAGVSTELHVWPGAFHGFDSYFLDAALSKRSAAARTGWAGSILSKKE
ncbi:alpha/beta hydrolase fold-3 domain-containing protein [Penicillium taxi]|uniref:alpha/beta hydrolase fold-3 domain-containing protein n=1 Tax=Penicillium taxi TaxID=168475 RepID=UPI0025453707|nr:alpha/beta hydrolase fold-3 domain-containing protein [Penicillium taxi]KAJ5888360.1 alpha/beta hydrolase fold-3 domain-containing protein [Penicillium taxi]